MECQICCESFNKSTRKPVKCPNCGMNACRSCVSAYVADSVEEAHCMGCKHFWSRQMLSQAMTKKWMCHDYRDHRERVLHDREKARLPMDLPYLESRKRLKALYNERKTVSDELTRLSEELQRVDGQIVREHNFYHSNQPNKEERLEVRGHCVQETCNGLISTAWKCTTCDTAVCKSCMKALDGEHACSDEDKRSVALIRTSSKPCPNCSVRIQKIEGCNQMFCTNCFTAFDWRSLNIIRSGYFHNPHFADYQAEHGGTGDIYDIAAYNEGICVSFANISARIKEENYNTVSREHRRMRGYLLAANHIQEYETRRNPDVHEKRLRDVRVRFLNNEISEENFRVQTQRLDKSWQKSVEVAQIMETYTTVCREILARWAVHAEMRLGECERQIEQLYQHTLNSLADVHKWHNSRVNYMFVNCWV